MAMKTATLEKIVLDYIKGLPREALEEILSFIKYKRFRPIKQAKDNLTAELTHMSLAESSHLEEEFKNYKQLYPSE